MQSSVITLNLQGNNYTVTVANSGSGNKYYIDGVEAAELTLTKGLTYIFDVSDSSNSGHPFRFKDSSGNFTLQELLLQEQQDLQELQ